MKVKDGDTLHQEAFDLLLTAWTTLLSDSESFPKDCFTDRASSIFSCYLRCHIGVPDGTRCSSLPLTNDDEDIHELEEDDCVAYMDQLTGVAALGRACIAQSLPLLVSVFHARVSKFTDLQTHHSDGNLVSLHEDLHWLLLIAGFLLADDGIGEMLLVPQEIISFSTAQSSHVNVQKSIAFLATANGLGDSSGLDADNVDLVISLVGIVLHLVGLERRLLELNRKELLSPQVSRSSVWFLRRWCRSYLFPDLLLYSNFSSLLSAAFSQNSDAGRYLVRLLVDKVAFNLSVWTSEELLIVDTIELLLAVVESSPRYGLYMMLW